MRPLLLASLLAPLVAGALAGCTPYVGVTTATVSGPLIRVEQVDYGQIAVGADGLSGAEARAIAARIETAAGVTPDALEVTLFGGTEAVRREIEAIAARYGVPGRNVTRVSRADEVSKLGGSVVVFTLWVAVPPECEQRVLVGATPGATFADVGLGCATLVDLALAVANPRDLLGRPGVVLTDGRRAERTVATYREFGAVPVPRGTVTDSGAQAPN